MSPIKLFRTVQSEILRVMPNRSRVEEDTATFQVVSRTLVPL